MGSKRRKSIEPVTAIVSAYNEEKTIADVLKTLTKTKIIKEIIVIDDGSIDNTSNIIRKFKNIRYIKNKKNLGKAQSMDRGVKLASNDIIYFCDADLVNLTPKIVEQIVKPVATKEYDMFLGVRNYTYLKIFKKLNIKWSIFLISGQRALRKKIWKVLPNYYKSGFRVELGLNHIVKFHKKRLGYDIFPYGQIFKEYKYGFLTGFKLRLKMMAVLFETYLRIHLIDRFKEHKPLNF